MQSPRLRPRCRAGWMLARRRPLHALGTGPSSSRPGPHKTSHCRWRRLYRRRCASRSGLRSLCMRPRRSFRIPLPDGDGVTPALLWPLGYDLVACVRRARFGGATAKPFRVFSGLNRGRHAVRFAGLPAPVLPAVSRPAHVSALQARYPRRILRRLQKSEHNRQYVRSNRACYRGDGDLHDPHDWHLLELVVQPARYFIEGPCPLVQAAGVHAGGQRLC